MATPTTADRIIFADGCFVRLSEVCFAPNTQALNYGTGVFEGIRAYWDTEQKKLNLFRAEDHYARFISSAAILKMDAGYSVADFVEITKELLKRNDFKQDIYIRPLLLKKSLMPGEKFGVKLTGVSSSLCINALPMGAYAASDRFRCIVSKWRRVSNNAIPSAAKITGTYVNSALAFEDARENGADDAIMLNDRGQCTEATTSNLFIVKNGSVVTPPLEAGILEGITRDSIIKICGKLGIQCREAHLTTADLYDADQCFLSGTGIEVTPVAELDGRTYNIAETSIACLLRSEYQKLVRNKITLGFQWLSSVTDASNDR